LPNHSSTAPTYNVRSSNTLAPQTVKAVSTIEGDFFRFDLYQDWHAGELSLPITDRHFIVILLDTSMRCELRRDSSRYYGPMITGGVMAAPAGYKMDCRWSGLNHQCMHVQICKRWLAQQMANKVAPNAASDEADFPLYRDDPLALQIGLAIFDEMHASADAASTLTVQSAALMLGIRVLRRRDHRSISGERASGGLAGWQLRRVKVAMENADSTLSLADLASMAGVTPAHFCTAFRKSMGIPPHHWQRRQRVERAKKLLAEATQSLTEIALACGYASPSHFTTSFKRATGMTPSAYRREQ
jgi:AraC family transcriptional regulator